MPLGGYPSSPVASVEMPIGHVANSVIRQRCPDWSRWENGVACHNLNLSAATAVSTAGRGAGASVDGHGPASTKKSVDLRTARTAHFVPSLATWSSIKSKSRVMSPHHLATSDPWRVLYDKREPGHTVLGL